MSSSDIKLPLMPTPALDGQMFTGQQLETYARRTVELNKPEACLYYQGIVLARGNWAEMRDLQAIVLKGGMRVEVRATRDLGTHASVSDRGIELRIRKSVLGSDQGAELCSFWKGATVPHLGGAEMAKASEPEPFDLERAKAGEPIQTRGGLAARFVGFDKDMPKDRQVVVVVAPSILYSHRFADGRYSSAPGPHAYDLVMAPKPKRVVWVNTFKKPTPGGVTSMTFDTEAAAQEHGRRVRTCLATIAERKEI